MVAEVSPESLRTLIQRVRVGTSKAEEQALHEHLSGETLDAYTGDRNFQRLPQADFFRLFFVSGDASDAARRLGLSERTGRDWIRQFCEFIPRELKRTSDRQRTIDTARAQCEESCGRKERFTSGGQPPQKIVTAKTRQDPDMDFGGRCPACPLRGM